MELRQSVPEPNLGLQAARGDQPVLMREDWLRIAGIHVGSLSLYCT
jgi:hypothetical protein